MIIPVYYRNKFKKFMYFNNDSTQRKELLWKILGHYKFLKYKLIRSNNFLDFRFYIHACKKFDRFRTSNLRRLLKKMFLKKMRKRMKFILVGLKKINKRIKRCKFHWIKKFNCCFFKTISTKRKYLKIYLSYLYFSNHTFTRVFYRINQENVITAKIQGFKIKEMLGFKKISFRTAALRLIRYVMKYGARGAMVKVKGVYRSNRKRTFKFKKGIVKYSGSSFGCWEDCFKFNLGKKRGMLGIKIKIFYDTQKIHRIANRRIKIYLNRLSYKTRCNKFFMPGIIAKSKTLKILS
mmetsp:Transcript_24701/g.43907  ORF Transcript_24701/g.43907 Transcript_24701/m.43907 type:complete len:293 (-) Transcript_24701:2737-3615(-)